MAVLNKHYFAVKALYILADALHIPGAVGTLGADQLYCLTQTDFVVVVQNEIGNYLFGSHFCWKTIHGPVRVLAVVCMFVVIQVGP